MAADDSRLTTGRGRELEVPLPTPHTAPPSPNSFAVRADQRDRERGAATASPSGMRAASLNTADDVEVVSELVEAPLAARALSPPVGGGGRKSVDIVVVHGLEGDPEESDVWRASNGVRWLQDLLPASLPAGRARILLYKYDALTIHDCFGTELNRLMKAQARKLLFLLTELRDDAQRPVVFVGKGFGGLIVKQALIYSHSYASLQRNGATSEAPNTASEERVAKYRILKSAALGVVFFGTPHRGWKDASGMQYYSQVVPPAELELNKSRAPPPPRSRLSVMESRSEFKASFSAVADVGGSFEPLIAATPDTQSEVSANRNTSVNFNKIPSFNDNVNKIPSFNDLLMDDRDISPGRRLPESIRSGDKLFQWTSGRTAERAYLVELSRQFQHIVTQYEILTVFATRPGKTKSQNVNRSSAVLDVTSETVLPLDIPHNELVKFPSAEDKHYQSLAQNLRSMVDSVIKRTTELSRRLKQQDAAENIHPPSRTKPLPTNGGGATSGNGNGNGNGSAPPMTGIQRRKSEAAKFMLPSREKPAKPAPKGQRAQHHHHHFHPRLHLHHYRHTHSEKRKYGGAVTQYLEQNPLLTRYYPLEDDLPAVSYVVTAIRSGQCATHDVEQWECYLQDLGEGRFPWLQPPEPEHKHMGLEASQKLNTGTLWVHVPGNDRSWVEDVIQSVYSTRSKGPEAMPLEILGDEYWKYRECNARYGQSRRGTTWMEPSCMLIDDPDDPEPQLVIYMPYLHWESKAGYREQRAATDALLEAPEELRETYEKLNYEDTTRLRSSSLLGNLRYHPRRTIDQYYYSSLEDTRERDNDQIVGHKANEILMIDQLWVWVTGHDTLFTFFPEKRECDEPTPGPHLKTRFADLRDSIVRDLEETATDRDLCRDAFELAALAVKNAVNVMLCPDMINAHPNLRVLQIFQDTITETTEQAQKALRDFIRNPDELDLADMSNELHQLWRVTDIEDELNMLNHLLFEQRKVLDDFQEVLELHYRGQKTPRPRALVLIEDTLKDIDDYEKDVRKKQEHAEDTRKALTFLLDLKQKNANLQEARVTRQQQEQSVQQSRTMMIFTVFTVVFLPLSFFTSLYGMNVREWSGTPTNPRFRNFALYAGTVSTVIISFTLSIAFFTQLRNFCRRSWKFVRGGGRRRSRRAAAAAANGNANDVERLLPLVTLDSESSSDDENSRY